MQELRVYIHELRVKIHELRVQIYGLRVQIHKFKNYLIYETCTGVSSKYSITLKYRVYLRFYLIKIVSVLVNFGLQKWF